MIVGAAVLWGLIGPFSVWATRAGMHPSEVAFWRAALATLPFAALAVGDRPHVTARAVLGVAAFGAIGIAVMYGAFFNAVDRSGAGIAAVLLYTGPAWVAIFEWGAARKIPRKRSVAALLLTIGGVVLLSYDPGEMSRASRGGILFGLLSGLAFSTHFTLAPRYIARHGAGFVYALAMAVAALALIPVSQPAWPPAAAWPHLAFLALVATFAASLLFARGIVHVAPVRAAITATVEPVVATCVAILVLDSVLRAQQLLGALLVLGGVTIIMLQRSSGSTSYVEEHAD